MPGRYFITSRTGEISSYSVFRYVFAQDLNETAKKKICKWLTYRVLLNHIGQNDFSTFERLDIFKTGQYTLIRTEEYRPPYLNSVQLSAILNKFVGKCLGSHYSRFQNLNVFILEKLHFEPFYLLKCIQYHIEAFSDGTFLINMLPTAKIISDREVDEHYFNRLKQGARKGGVAELPFSLVDQRKFRRQKVDLLCTEADQLAELLKRGPATATFDYHFLATYNPELFGKITAQTENTLLAATAQLQQVAQKLILPEPIKLHPKPFHEVRVIPLLLAKNLLIGKGMKVNQQKAAYHQGMYRPVDDFIIQPVVIGSLVIQAFRELVNNYFNQEGTAEVHEPIRIAETDPLDPSLFAGLKAQFGKRIIFPIFTRYQLTRDFLDPIKNLGLRYQLYAGELNLYQLSNFTVKLLEKAGGLLSIINNLYEPESTYFIGLDMGHSRNAELSHTNLCMTAFDYQGRYLRHHLVEGIPRNEALNEKAVHLCLSEIKKFLQSARLPAPQKLVVHRDGKLHSGDIDVLLQCADKLFGNPNLDVLEVIKSGYPLIVNYFEGKYQNLKSGEYWALEDKKYAVLVTNTQADHEGEVLNPIVIKQKHGDTPFTNLIEQVYWFTKVYTNNLYNSTRLPATTEKANNLVGTGSKQHVSTYLA